MKMPAVRLEECRSPYQVNGAGRGARKATSSDPIDQADRDFAEILARARFLQPDRNVARPSSANDSGTGTAPASPVWSGRTRLGLMIGLPLALWAGIFVLVRFAA